MIILRATNLNGLKVDLDVMDVDQPLTLDISAIENTEIGDVFGVSSQTFSLPGTNKNNQFFGNLYDLGATPAVALKDSIDCQLLTDGQEVFTGKLYINDVITDQQGYTTYQVTLVNETVDFKFQLTDVLLAELDWTPYNHAYTYGNVTSSWDGNLLGGDIIYPNVDYGRPEEDVLATTYAFSNSSNTGAFDVSLKPLRVDNFLPAIRAKAIIDNMFNAVDYVYTSSFFDSAYFNNLYVLSTDSDTMGVINSNPASGSFYAYKTSTENFNALTDTLINFQAETYDDFNRYNLINDEYVAYAPGQYGFTLAFTFSISNWDINNRLRFFVTLQDDSGTQLTGRTFVDPPATGQVVAPFPLINLDTGDKVRAYVELLTDDGSEVVTLGSGVGNSYFTLRTAPLSSIGGTVNIGDQFPTDMKALDFMQGLIEKFNLVVEPVPGTRNVLRIEPFQDWIDTGKVVDWTDKVDRSVRFSISHPILDQPKTIEFRDADDEAALNKYTVDKFGDVYGTYIYENDSDLCNGTRSIGGVFAATPVKNIPNSTDFIIPMLYKREPGEEPRPFKFKPRLLYANGKKTVSNEAYGWSIGNGGLLRGIARGRYFFEDENAIIHPVTSWYQMTPYESLDATGTARDLHYGNRKNPGWWPYFQNSVPFGFTENSSFHYYWETYINSLYDIDARKLVCNIYLKPTEIQNIALNDKIFIDGHYYRINSINGANVTERASVEVELIKELNRKLTYPRRRVTTAGGGRTDIQVSTENPSGRVVYVDSETGATVEDAFLINQAAAKDGYMMFTTGDTGSAVWNYIAPTNMPQERSVTAGNEVDPINTRITVNGTVNTVKQNVTDVTVNGSGNTISEFTDTVLMSGIDNSVDIDQQNLFLVGALAGEIVNGTDNSGIIGGSGSYLSNGDNVISINGEADAITDSDYTVAINSHNNEVIINGSGHAVIGLNREGGGLDLLNTRANTNWLGDTYLGGALFRDQVQLECGDGYEIILTGSNYTDGRHENLYILNWSGLSPGTTTIELPSATNNDYENVVYQFQTNGTFDGTTEVEITGFNGLGQTINGQANYILSDPYAGVTLTTYDGDWIVLSDAASAGVGFWGSFYASASQPLGAPDVSQSVALTSTYGSNEVYIASGSRIYFNYPGVYQFNYNVQVANSSNQAEEANFWIKYNGVDYPNSNTFLSLAAEKNASTPTYQLMACTFTGTAQNAGDYIELYWDGTSTDLSLYYTGSNGEPATPSVIANVIPVGTSAVISSQTAVSASYALTASYAENAPNIYNSNGNILDNRTVSLNGNDLTFEFTGGETLEFQTDPSSTIQMPGLLQASQSMVIGFNSSTGQLTAMNTSSFGGGGDPFPYTGKAIITGSLEIFSDDTAWSGSVLNVSGANVVMGDGSGYIWDGIIISSFGNAIIGTQNSFITAKSSLRGAAIVGGVNNSISGSGLDGPVVVGGFSNLVISDYGTIVGGRDNDVLDEYASIVGGRLNVASEQYSAVIGGYSNYAQHNQSVALGGRGVKTSKESELAVPTLLISGSTGATGFAAYQGGLMTMKPWATLPSASTYPLTFAVSGSKPYFSDGSSWNALY